MATDRFVEAGLVNGFFGALNPNSGCWSMTDARFDEMVSTKQPEEPWLPLTGMEQSIRNTLHLLSAHELPLSQPR